MQGNEPGEVELTVSFDETDTVFLTFDGGGTAKVIMMGEDTIKIIGDDPIPTPLEQYEVEVEESFSWGADLPLNEKGVWSPFINSIQIYNK